MLLRGTRVTLLGGRLGADAGCDTVPVSSEKGAVSQMIIRLITYHALPDRDVEGWLRGMATELRGVPGMQHVEFVRSVSDPSQYGALMHFRAKEDLDNYKATDAYRRLVQSTRETWLDDSKPVHDEILGVLEI